MRLNEAAARGYAGAHEHIKDLVGVRGVFNSDLQERTRLRIHRRFPQLIRIHLAQTLVALDCDFVRVLEILDFPLEQFVVGGAGFRMHVLHLLAVFQQKDWRLRDIQMPLLNDLRHVAEEECQQQSANVAAIDIGVRHDDDAPVTQTVDCHLVVDARAQRGNQRFDFVVVEDLVDTRALGIEDLAA